MRPKLTKKDVKQPALPTEKQPEPPSLPKAYDLHQQSSFLHTNEFELILSDLQITTKTIAEEETKVVVLRDLPLTEQERIMKESLDIVHGASKQLNIIFRHYCKVQLQKEYTPVQTFQSFQISAEIMSMNRYMLFCREFEILKSFKLLKKTSPNTLLMTVFKRNADHFKYMLFDRFLLSLVHIALKIYQDHDARTFSFLTVFITFLKINTLLAFEEKLKKLQIHATQAELYDCFKTQIKKDAIKEEKSEQLGRKSKLEIKIKIKIKPAPVIKEKNYKKYEEIQPQPKIENIYQSAKQEGSMIEHKSQLKQSEPVLGPPFLPSESTLLPQGDKQSSVKRRSSLPMLPRIEDNRYFKHIEHNGNLNGFKNYLEAIPQSSGVSKNRITGYSTIRMLSKDNPEHLTKEQFAKFMSKALRAVKDEDQMLQTHVREGAYPKVNAKLLNTIQRMKEEKEEKEEKAVLPQG